MHLLQIVHCDIKPENIMYSQTFGKNVLLDYGLTDIINQKWGKKTLTKFKGTYRFCGD